MAIWRKKPIQISAWELVYGGSELPPNVVGNAKLEFHQDYFDGDYYTVTTMEGVMRGKPNDYLIQGVAGEYYICDREIFFQTYELVYDFTA